MMYRKFLAVAVATCIMGAVTQSANAATFFFVGDSSVAGSVAAAKAGFAAAAGAVPIPLMTETFDTTGPTVSGLGPVATPAGIVITEIGPPTFAVGMPVTADGLIGNPGAGDRVVTWGGASAGVGALTFAFPGGPFPAGINAFGIDFYDLGTTLATTLTLGTSVGGTAAVVPIFPSGIAPPATGWTGFIGVVDTLVSFTTATFGNVVSEIVEFDDLMYGTASSMPPTGDPVPEPTSMALFGLTALGLAFGARRRKRKAQPVGNRPTA